MCVALKNYLKRFNISVSAFADSLDVSHATVSRYVAGDRVPSKKVMAKIVRLTSGQVTPNDFYELPIDRQVDGVSADDTRQVHQLSPSQRGAARLHGCAGASLDVGGLAIAGVSS